MYVIKFLFLEVLVTVFLGCHLGLEFCLRIYFCLIYSFSFFIIEFRFSTSSCAFCIIIKKLLFITHLQNKLTSMSFTQDSSPCPTILLFHKCQALQGHHVKAAVVSWASPLRASSLGVG